MRVMDGTGTGVDPVVGRDAERPMGACALYSHGSMGAFPSPGERPLQPG